MLSDGYLVTSGEALGFSLGSASLHVDDLSIPDRQYLVSLARLVTEPEHRADDPVGADSDELGLGDSRSTPFVDPPREHLTGLVRTASGRNTLPPHAAVRKPAPLGVISEQGRKRGRVAVVQRLCCRAKLVEHRVVDHQAQRISGLSVITRRGCAK
jgi:hypothetical protein